MHLSVGFTEFVLNWNYSFTELFGRQHNVQPNWYVILIDLTLS